MNKMNLLPLFFILFSCKFFNPAPPIQLDKIKLPDGFKIDIYVDNIRNARSLAMSPAGTLFIGTRDDGRVWAVRDEDHNYKAEKVYTIASGLNSPNGVAFKDGDLYVGEINRILRFKDIEKHLDNPGAPEVVYDKYPTETHHGWKYIAFGPDGKLYVPVGAPCNICESKDPIFNTITRLDVNTKKMEIVEYGIRNSVGMAWDPDNKSLWFTDNGRDWMGDDIPSCELNHATRDAQHFGYPYCHQGDIPDPEFGTKRSCSEFVPPAQKLGPHVAPLGLEFYTGRQFPSAYHKQILVAEHGSWNRKTPLGYRIALVTLDKNRNAVNNTIFAEGWLQGGRAWGRPVDLEQMADGSLLVSDDYANVVYRISYGK
ncbi:MAG: PQQ-dependent sugar dehydrogenase [Saprospiraceae bacterium]